MLPAAPVLGERRFDLVGEPQWIVAVIFDLGHWVVPDVQWRPPSEERACPLPQLCRAARKERAPRRGRGFQVDGVRHLKAPVSPSPPIPQPVHSGPLFCAPTSVWPKNSTRT